MLLSACDFLKTVTPAGASAHKCSAFDTLPLESLLSGIDELHGFFFIAHSKRFGNAICGWVYETAVEKCRPTAPRLRKTGTDFQRFYR